MEDFIISKSNFGVEARKSRFGFKKVNNVVLLTIDIHGNEKAYEEISNDEDSEWSWTLYPPHFYLHDYPVSERKHGSISTITLKPDDSDKYDMAVYMMEHNVINGATIQLSETEIEISGQVDIMGKLEEFQIYWEK